jgi:hypothetical protein
MRNRQHSNIIANTKRNKSRLHQEVHKSRKQMCKTDRMIHGHENTSPAPIPSRPHFIDCLSLRLQA